MIYGLSGAPLRADGDGNPLPLAGAINGACMRPARPFSPALLYAIYWQEMGRGHGRDPDGGASRLQDGADPDTGLMPDGTNAGRGAFQLTSSWPDNWQDPFVSACYAIDVFLSPAIAYWHGLEGYSGNDLVLLVAATYNEGLGAARDRHAAGDVDAGTTDHYGHSVLAYYLNIVSHGMP